MLKFGNKEFRNLQEQVEKNMKDILFMLQEEGVLNEFGIKVVGQETSITNMPTVEDYKEAHEDWNYGDAYAIGTEAPYSLYILTRANGTHPNDYWFNIGSFPVPGPQGPQGPQGETGPQGQTGNPGTDGAAAGFGSVTATAVTLDPDEEATVSVVTSGPNTEKSFAFTFGIPKGEDGESGTEAVWGNITGSLSDQTDLITALQGKQNTLVSGTNIKTISGNSILGNGDIKISTLQATSTVVIDALTNLNGRILGNYEATLDTSTPYTYYVITKGGSQLTEEQARDYMEYMTGSRFLPVFDYETPENSLFVFANGSLWKPQFDNEGLKLYALPNPYASKVDLTNYVTLASDQNISGKKEFGSGKLVTPDIYAPNIGGGSTYRAFNLYGGIVAGNTIRPSSNARKENGIVYGFDLGEQNFRWRDLYLYRSLRDGNNANYGLALPDTTSFTANKTIATTDQLFSGSYDDLSNKPTFATVATSGDYSDLINKPTLGTAAAKDFTTSVTSGSNDLVTSGAVYSAIEALPEPMVFKGSIGEGGTIEWINLPAAASSNNGFTYKVITAHDTDPICEIGDTIISDGTAWVVIPSGDEPSGTVTSVGLSMPTGFTVSSSPVISSGTLAVTLASGYELLNSNSTQTISGAKTFTSAILMKNNVGVKYGNSYSNGFTICNDGGGGLLFKNNYNVSKYHFTDSYFYPDVSGASNLGTRSKAWGDLYLTGAINKNTSNYGLALPDTTSYTANKTIATTDDLTNYVTLDTYQTITADKYFTGSVSIGGGLSASGTDPIVLSSDSDSSIEMSGTEIYIGTIGKLKIDAPAILTPDNSTYGVVIPTTTGWTANKTLATTDQIPSVPDIYYKNNDTLVTTDYYLSNGYLTNGGKEISFIITTPKLLDNVTSITVNKLSCVFRGVSGYVNGNSYIDYSTASGYTVQTLMPTNNTILVRILGTNAFSSGTNNTPISIAFDSTAGLSLTFTAS